MRAQSLYESRRKSHILFFMKPINTPQYTIELALGQTIEHLPVIIRKHPKSRRMVLRYHPLQHNVGLTLPRYVSIRQGLHFIEEKRSWLIEQINSHARHVPFTDGQYIPVLGKNYLLRFAGGRGVVMIHDEMILVPGDESFMKRRVLDWLKAQAKESITSIAIEKCWQLGKPYKKISLRDTSSRWGSCSHDGNLSFSWRLIFAPLHVLEYVVSHEVAHLKHHDHSPAFWAAVTALCPNLDASRQWLKDSGTILYSYG